MPEQAVLWQQNEQWGTHKNEPESRAECNKERKSQEENTAHGCKITDIFASKIDAGKKKIYQGCNILLSLADRDLKMVNKENQVR